MCIVLSFQENNSIMRNFAECLLINDRLHPLEREGSIF